MPIFVIFGSKNVIHRELRSHLLLSLSLLNRSSVRFRFCFKASSRRSSSLFFCRARLSRRTRLWSTSAFVASFFRMHPHLRISFWEKTSASTIDGHTQLWLQAHFPWPMFVPILHGHPLPLPRLHQASGIPFSQPSRSMSVLIVQCHLPPLPTSQVVGDIPFSPFLVLHGHVLLLPALQASSPEWSSGLVKWSDLLQNLHTVKLGQCPCLSNCTLKSLPGIFKMDGTVPPVHTSSSHAFGIYSKWL